MLIYLRFYEQYDDLEVGSLEADEIQGTCDNGNNEKILEYAVEFKQEKKFIPYDKSVDKERIAKLQEESDSSSDEMTEVSDGGENKWDCETILSTYSNLYNHPKMISEPTKDKKVLMNNKTGIPLDAISKSSKKLSSKSLAKLEKVTDLTQNGLENHDRCGTIISSLTSLSVRPKDETPAEKKERKRLVKEQRSERRVERKANTLAFKQERMRQMRMKTTNMLSVRSSKIE